jgi:hypothetical protein
VPFGAGFEELFVFERMDELVEPVTMTSVEALIHLLVMPGNLDRSFERPMNLLAHRPTPAIASPHRTRFRINLEFKSPRLSCIPRSGF